MNILVFTLCSNNYLPAARALGDSLAKHHPDYEYRIGLVDKKTVEIDYDQYPFEVVELDKLGIDGLDHLVLSYNITELNTAVKPFYFRYFMDGGDAYDAVLYLDPDILVYNRFDEMEKELKGCDVVLTPHFTTPINDEKILSEEDILNTGLYNLGFICIRNNEVGHQVVSWWADRLRNKAFIDFEKGMFTDQIWANLIPLFFEPVNIFKNRGYNMAYWNLHERELVETENCYLVNGDDPLVFYHFSGFDPLHPEVLSKYQDRFQLSDRPDIAPLFSEYRQFLLESGYESYRSFPCTYAEIKAKHDALEYKKVKQTVPLSKRMIRGLLLRIIRRLNIPMDYHS